MNVFIVCYWLALLIEIIVRAPFQKASQAAPKLEQRVSPVEKLIPGLLTIGMILFPLLYSVTHWLDFANYSLPGWMGWLGVCLLAGALLVFARSHIDLKANWSPTLEIRKDHTLVTTGIYAIIRHPMYTSQWLWVIAQILLLQNWLAGPLNLLVFTVFYIIRLQAEEKMMLETFGSQYSEYMQKVGGLIPKLFK